MFRAPAKPIASPPSNPLDHGGKKKSVLVLGAGLAGLTAAYRLHEAGHGVTVLEARDRPGGRVETLRAPFTNGFYAEAGAVFIPWWHGLVRSYAQDFGLDLVPMPPSPPSATLWYLHGRREVGPCHPASEWPVQLSSAEAKAVDESEYGVFELFRLYMPERILDAVQDWGGGPPVPPDLARYDDLSFREFLESSGASPGAIDIVRLGYFDLWGEGIDSVSALLLLRDFALNATPPHLRVRSHRAHLEGKVPEERSAAVDPEAGPDGPSEREEGVEAYTIQGGNERLPRALADRLEGRIHYQCAVKRIEWDSSSVTVVCRGLDGPQQFQADRAVCTIPFSVLKDVEVDPDFSAEKRSAIDHLPYTQVNRTYVRTATRFWTSPSPVDGSQQVPYGSGNTDLLGQWLHDATAFQPGQAGIVEAYRAGGRAAAVEGMTEEARMEVTLKSLTTAYPGLDAPSGPGAFKSWTHDPWSLGGYCWFRPGQMTSLLPSISAPEGPIHFAGDHASPAPGWMEGAIESGHRAAEEVNGAS